MEISDGLANHFFLPSVLTFALIIVPVKQVAVVEPFEV